VFKIIPYLKSFLHITALYPYVWQILGKLKEAVIEDHGNTEYDSGSSKYDNYITKYGNNSKDNFSLHYVTFPGKGRPCREPRCPLNRRPLGYPHYRMVITVVLGWRGKG